MWLLKESFWVHTVRLQFIVDGRAPDCDARWRHTLDSYLLSDFGKEQLLNSHQSWLEHPTSYFTDLKYYILKYKELKSILNWSDTSLFPHFKLKGTFFWPCNQTKKKSHLHLQNVIICKYHHYANKWPIWISSVHLWPLSYRTALWRISVGERREVRFIRLHWGIVYVTVKAKVNNGIPCWQREQQR